MRKEMKYHSLKKTGILTVLAAVCFSLPGCGGTEKKSEISETVSDLHDDSAEKEISNLAEASDELTVWSAYWDCEDDIDTLKTEADKKDLDVRIILEPSTPTDELDFPQGASYAVMCYNLYGNGTDPGPKADLDFIKEMYTKFKDLPDIYFALSNGGYDWENGTQKATQKKRVEIEQLIQQYKAEPQRDTNSGALSFEYEENHTKHIIWYADEETLKQWTEELNFASGGKVKVSLWRI